MSPIHHFVYHQASQLRLPGKALKLGALYIFEARARIYMQPSPFPPLVHGQSEDCRMGATSHDLPPVRASPLSLLFPSEKRGGLQVHPNPAANII